MRSRQNLIAYGYIGLLTLAMGMSLLSATPSPQDDFGLYQKFIETLADGSLDLSIPGFHGSDFFAVPLYWLFHSPIAQIHALMMWALLLPLAGFLAGRALFGNLWHGVILASIVSMMPFISFVLFRGWTGPAYWVLMLLTVYGAAKSSRLTGVAWACAMLTKPFAIGLLPLLIVLSPKGKRRERFTQIFIGLGIVAVYMTIQFMQAGHLIVGSHADTTAGEVLQSPLRVALNLAHSLQILFSVHNYYFPNPSLTGPGNMLHTTPILIFLGLFGLLATKTYFPSPRRALSTSLQVGILIGLGMNAALDHMDHFYMEAAVLLFIIAALPVLRAHQLWIPIVLATLHFQWLYFYIQYKPGFLLDGHFFLVPLIVDLCFVGYCIARPRVVRDLFFA